MRFERLMMRASTEEGGGRRKKGKKAKKVKPATDTTGRDTGMLLFALSWRVLGLMLALLIFMNMNAVRFCMLISQGFEWRVRSSSCHQRHHTPGLWLEMQRST